MIKRRQNPRIPDDEMFAIRAYIEAHEGENEIDEDLLKVRHDESGNFGKYTREEFFDAIKEFRGDLAPGVILSGIMVELALERLEKGTDLLAMAEYSVDIPDAIQLLTKCTVGNGKLIIHETGKYALTLFDRKTGKGIRSFVDSKNLEKFPLLNKWIMHEARISRDEMPDLIDSIISDYDSIISVMKVVVSEDIYEDIGEEDSFIMCPLCFEPMAAKYGDKCAFCKGVSPFESVG